MKPLSWRVIVGVLMLLFGGLALFQTLTNYQYQGDLWGILFAILFFLAGVAFTYVFFSDRTRNWWSVIPGFTMIGLGLLIGSQILFPRFPGTVSAAVFLAAIGLSFIVIYLNNRSQWWPIIPGGVMLSVAALVVVADYSGEIGVSIMFLGIAATFAALALIKQPNQQKMQWAWIPAGIMAALALLMGLIGGAFSGYIWAAALILVGGYLVIRSFLSK